MPSASTLGSVSCAPSSALEGAQLLDRVVADALPGGEHGGGAQHEAVEGRAVHEAEWVGMAAIAAAEGGGDVGRMQCTCRCL